MVGLWGAGHYTFVLARLGPLHLGCNREVAALLRWLLTVPGIVNLETNRTSCGLWVVKSCSYIYIANFVMPWTHITTGTPF